MNEVTITSMNYKTEVENSPVPVLLDFWAEWCGPCRMLAPELAAAAEKYDGKIKVGKVNVDDESRLATKFGVVSIPMLVVIKGGKIVKTSVGYCTSDEISQLVDSVLSE